MILSFIVYTFTGLALYALGKMNANKPNTIFWSPEIVIMICLFGFIAGARYNVGVDHLSYLNQYINLQNAGWLIRDTFEPGFIYITKWFAHSGIHYSIYFAFWAMLQFFFVYYALKNKKYLYPYLGLTIMLTPIFLSWMNGIRQSVVCCAFVFLIKFIQKRRFLPYIIGVFISSLIHKSAWILLPLYFLLYRNYFFQQRILNIFLLFSLTIIGNITIGNNLFQPVTILTELLDYEYYTENISTIMEDTRDMTWGPIRIILYLTDLLIIWFYPTVQKHLKNDRMLNLYFSLFFIGTCAYNLLVMYGIMFSRITMYFTTFRLILTTYILYSLHIQKLNKQFKLFAFISLSYIYLSILKLWVTNINESPVYYKFFF